MGNVTQVDPGFTSRNNFDAIDAALYFLSLVNLSCFIVIIIQTSDIIKNRNIKVDMTSDFFALSRVVDFDDASVFTIRKTPVLYYGYPRKSADDLKWAFSFNEMENTYLIIFVGEFYPIFDGDLCG